jgi:hypothetical protein
MNSNTTTAANTSAKARKPRAPRAKKPVAENKIPETAPKAETKPATTAAQVAAALFILVTLPPVEKFEAGKGYWQIEIRDNAGKRYSDIYRTKDLNKAHELAEKMAAERRLQIVTKEPPKPWQPVNPDAGKDLGDVNDLTPQEVEDDNLEPTPF